MDSHDSAGGAGGLDAPEQKDPQGEDLEDRFRFSNDLAFLAEVGRRLAPLAERPSLAPEKARALERAVAALRKLPELTPEINVQIEIAHRMGDEQFSETYTYLIKVDQQGVEVRSTGSQEGTAVEPNSCVLESLKRYADGQTEYQGNRDIWLERLVYALARDYTLTVTDESGDQ